MNPHVWWYLSRSSGIVAWAMLTASVLWGVLLASPLLGRWKKAAWLLDLHRWLGALALSFTGIHVAALIADRTVDFGFADVLVPFMASWHPVAVSLGVVALWLVVAVQITSALRRHLPRRVWHAVHLTSYASFWLVSLHGAAAGTDASTPMYRAGAIVTIGATLFATVYRLLDDTPRGSRRSSATSSRRTTTSASRPSTL